MPEKHPNTKRIGGPGASHENRKEPTAITRSRATPSVPHMAKAAATGGSTAVRGPLPNTRPPERRTVARRASRSQETTKAEISIQPVTRVE